MAAVKDVWLLGDCFIMKNFHELVDINREASMDKRNKPYIEQYYNIVPQFPTDSSKPKNVFLRLADTIITVVNECKRLPRFVIIMLDNDMLKELCRLQSGFTEPAKMDVDIKKSINWLVNFVDRTITPLKTDMYYKKPGSAMAAKPKYIWVKALPANANNKVEFFRNFFNKCLENKLATKRHSYILDATEIVHEEGTFDMDGNLLPAARVEFWNELSQQIDLFNKCKLDLHPEPEKHLPRVKSQVVPIMQRRRELPPPPPPNESLVARHSNSEHHRQWYGGQYKDYCGHYRY